MEWTTVIDGEEYRNQLGKEVEKLSGITCAEESAYMHGTSHALITNKVVTSLRYVKDGRGISSVVHGMLLEACYRSEMIGADSSDMCASFSLALIDEILKLKSAGHSVRSIHKQLEEEFVDFKSRLSIQTPTRLDLVQAVNQAIEKPLLAAMVVEAIDLAGLEGVILPEYTVNATPSIELVTGYHFKSNPNMSFLGPDGKWKKERVKILLIDGVIEKVSEIHGLLEAFAATKEPAIFITRGYDPEVLHTLKVNHDRRTLRIMPVVVPFDLEGINMLNDIAVVCGTDMVSSAKGQLISSVKYQDLVKVDGVTCQRGSMIISNTANERNVRKYAKMLTERMEKEKVEDMSELLLKRIRSLNSHYVKLRVASKSEQEKIHDLEAVDMGLRVVKTVMSHGMMNVQDIKANGLVGRAIKRMQTKTGRKPVLSVLSAIQHGLSFATMATSVESAVALDVTR